MKLNQFNFGKITVIAVIAVKVFYKTAVLVIWKKKMIDVQ